MRDGVKKRRRERYEVRDDVKVVTNFDTMCTDLPTYR